MTSAMVFDSHDQSLLWQLSADPVREEHAGKWGFRIRSDAKLVLAFDFIIVPGCEPVLKASSTEPYL